MLKFKSGAALMVLGCPELVDGHYTPVPTILPVGLTYEKGHRFRSRALIKFGEPIHVDKQSIVAFNNRDTKHEACDKLMASIRDAVSQQTTCLRDYDDQNLLWAIRRLVKPNHTFLSMAETARLSRSLIAWYEAERGNPEVAAVCSQVLEYSDTLKHHGVKDHFVHMTILSRSRVCKRLLSATLVLVGYGLILGPVLVLGAPLICVTRAVSQYKADRAVKSSRVKLQGNDVLATWKVLTALITIPVFWLLYTLLAWIYFGKDVMAVVFYVLPFYFLLGVHLADRVREIFITIPPLLWTLWGSHKSLNIAYQRTELQLRLRELMKNHEGLGKFYQCEEESTGPKPRLNA